eukprot:GHRR01022106.1.p1 GENE.GHRR01022106.1~~GHRR01022106.1.p1  ORF type:complete len:188 (+),score=31.69 GHRR01022106.1:124-687(+)
MQCLHKRSLARGLPGHGATRAAAARRCCRQTFKHRDPGCIVQSAGTEVNTGPEYPWAQPAYLDAAVSQLPDSQQAAAVAAITAVIAAGTALNTSVLGPAVSAHLPDFLQVTRTSWFPLGPIFIAAGVAHFTELQGFLNMYPHQGMTSSGKTNASCMVQCTCRGRSLCPTPSGLQGSGPAAVCRIGWK